MAQFSDFFQPKVYIYADAYFCFTHIITNIYTITNTNTNTITITITNTITITIRIFGIGWYAFAFLGMIMYKAVFC